MRQIIILTLFASLTLCLGGDGGRRNPGELADYAKKSCGEFLEPELYNKCLSDMARSTKNPDTCLLVRQVDTREACLSAVTGMTGQLATCRNLTMREYRAECIKNAAVFQKDFDMCGEIEIESIKTLCQAQSRK